VRAGRAGQGRALAQRSPDGGGTVQESLPSQKKGGVFRVLCRVMLCCPMLGSVRCIRVLRLPSRSVSSNMFVYLKNYD